MAGRGNPSFLKNQKAQKRVAKANAKRAARLARSAERATNRETGPAGENEDLAMDGVAGPEDEGTSVDEPAAPGD